MNCLMNMMSSAVTSLPRYLHTAAICRDCAKAESGTQAPELIFLCAHTSPHWRCFRIGITGGEQ